MHIPTCPTCAAALDYVRAVPWDVPPNTQGTLPPGFAAFIFRCAAHGPFRVYMSGPNVTLPEVDVAPELREGERGRLIRPVWSAP
jgi:hypothetical protein